MNCEQKRSEAVNRFQAEDYAGAARLFGELMAESESAALWSNWATAKARGGETDEAEAGYRFALDAEPDNLQLARNLGGLLAQQGRHAEALPLLKRGIAGAFGAERAAAERLLAECKAAAAFPPELDRSETETFLRGFLPADENERSYFETHLGRYAATIDLLPSALPGQKLLELGAAFHHMTPAMQRLRGYDVTCSDVWEGAGSAVRSFRRADSPEEYSFPVDNFDAERAPWPYPDNSFDVVLFCEMLEHLSTDPMLVLSEINRVTVPGGLLLLTTPNIASTKSVEYALRGDSPYVYGQYEPHGRPTDRHNREYTAGEVERIAAAAGFDAVRILTRDSWWRPNREVLRRLAASGYPVAKRGDNVLLLARKASPVRERYPEEFYLMLGSQNERRERQDAAAGPFTITLARKIWQPR